MFRKTLLVLAGASALALGAGGAVTPALANYAYCVENPSAKGCPGNFDVRNEGFYLPRGQTIHSPVHKSAEHRAQTRHHG
jgi:hypothetical protein